MRPVDFAERPVPHPSIRAASGRAWLEAGATSLMGVIDRVDARSAAQMQVRTIVTGTPVT